MHNHNLLRRIESEDSVSQLYNQHINDDNNYVNLHDVTNLGLYNKLILVTQKQVLEFYITAIEYKTINGHRTLSQHFLNATSNAYHLSNATNRPYVQDIEETRPSSQLLLNRSRNKHLSNSMLNRVFWKFVTYELAN